MKHKVQIVYDGEKDSKFDEILTREALVFKGEFQSSGYGFGQRDIDFDFPNRKKARQFVQFLVDLDLDGLGFSIGRCLTEEELDAL